MATITLNGSDIHTTGRLPLIGSPAPDFTLTDSEMNEKSLSDYQGKKLILNIFPSIDTPVCAASVRRFNREASAFNNTLVLCISADLPFAHERFCGSEGLLNVHTLSCFRHSEFGENYGVMITDGALYGLLSRAVILTDEKGRVVYSEQVPEIAQEPDYVAALKALMP